MDAIALLIADHNRIRGMFSRFKQAQEAKDAATMSGLATAIFGELEVHTRIEEDIFYPWVKGLAEPIRESVDEGLQEHHVVNTLMAETSGLEPGSDEWTAKLTVIIESVEHHAGEEEEELFPKVRSHSTADQRRALGDDLETGKARLGAPTLADKIDLTTEHLRRLASDQQIPGRSGMDHDELAATVAPD